MDTGPEATTSGLSVRGLVVALGAQTVLDGVHLRVRPGRVVVVEGASGAGKSTLLRCLVRLVEPAGGEVRLDGADVRTLDARVLRRRVGLVAQAPVMLSGTVADNLRYANAALSEDDLVRALAQAGLAPAFAARSATALSGGERARVAVARALARSPDVLLLDEPTAALDAVAAGHLAETIRGLARDGLAICIATHDAALAAAVADDRLVLT